VSRRVWMMAGVAACAAVVAWVLFVGLPRWYAQPRKAVAAAPGAVVDESADRKIRATLYYVADGGLNLVGVEREVPFADATVEQAQRLVEAQLAPVAAPLTQAIPEGTALRSVFLGEHGDAYVDLSAEVSTKHTGGSLEELFTVYAIVNVLAVNLPAIKGVQILVDGREVETLAGHVDLRRPLAKNLSLLAPPTEGSTAAPPSGTNP
jgi:spore germination protein GerM